MSNSKINMLSERNIFLSRYKSKILLSAKIFIALGLLIYIISVINLQEIITAIQQANIYLIAAAFLLSFINIYLQYYKWRITANLVLQENSNSKIWLSLFYGFSAGVFTPARIGEYFGRAIVFKNQSLVRVTLATLLDKVYLLLIVAFLGSISSIIFIHFYYQVANYLTIGLIHTAVYIIIFFYSDNI